MITMIEVNSRMCKYIIIYCKNSFIVCIREWGKTQTIWNMFYFYHWYKFRYCNNWEPMLAKWDENSYKDQKCECTQIDTTIFN